MGRRTLLLISAVVLAALGVTLVFLYVNNLRNAAYDNAALVKVLVAKDTVDPGVTAAQAQQDGLFEQKVVPKEFFVAGGISTVDPIADQVAIAPIYPGAQITAQMFGQPGQTSALSIPKGKLAVSVQLGDPNRVAGFLVPGSTVAVFATLKSGTAGTSDKTQLLLPAALVIGVGPTTTTTTTTTTTDTNNQTTQQIPQTILTLALDQRQAQKLIFAQSQGELYFGLLTTSSQVRPTGPTTDGNLFR